jgi:DNA excision repair protein ERCC-4
MNQGIEKKSHLTVDFREQRSGILEEIGKINDQLTIEICTLQTGDYLICDKIIVERKTLFDFLISIKNGRIFQQAYRMAQSGKNCLIILEGDKSAIPSTSMSRKAVQGALIHIEVFIGIPVIHSLNIRETAELLTDILHQSNHQELPRQKQIISRSTGIRINKKQRQKLFLLQNLPGIGTNKALSLLKTFGTIESILHASTDDLMKVKGIGKKLSKSIIAIFHEPF